MEYYYYVFCFIIEIPNIWTRCYIELHPYHADPTLPSITGHRTQQPVQICKLYNTSSMHMSQTVTHTHSLGQSSTICNLLRRSGSISHSSSKDVDFGQYAKLLLFLPWLETLGQNQALIPLLGNHALKIIISSSGSTPTNKSRKI